MFNRETIYLSKKIKDPRTIHAIVFDMGGVIFPLDHMRICEKLSKFCEYDPETIYNKILISDLKKDFDKGIITPRTFYGEVAKILELQELTFDNFVDIWVNIFQKNQHVWQLIKEFKDKGMDLYLLSNTDRLHFEYLENQYNVSRLFNSCVLSFEVGKHKPEPEIFRELSQEADSPPENLVFIDDTRRNVEGARKSGLNGILFDSYNQLKEDLIDFGVIWTISDSIRNSNFVTA